TEAYGIADKQARHDKLNAVKAAMNEALCSGETPKFSAGKVKDAFGELEARVVRNRILDGKPRIDGRDLKTVRPLSMGVGVLPRTDGSALRSEERRVGKECRSRWS